VSGVGGADVDDRARRAGDRVRPLDLGVLGDRVAHLGAAHPPLAEQLDEGVRAPAVGLRVDRRRVTADHAACLEAIDTPLDGRSGEGDAAADVLERAPGVLP
jgi:hypothetical protein